MKRTIISIKRSMNIVFLIFVPLIASMVFMSLINKDMRLVTGALRMPLILAGAIFAYFKLKKENTVRSSKIKMPNLKLTVAYLIFSASAAYWFRAVFASEKAPEENGLIMLIIVPITEELLFRCILTELIKKGKARRSVQAALVSSFCWAIFCYPHIYKMLSVFFFGILLSYIYQSKGSVWYCIAIRAGISLASAMIMTYPPVTSNVLLISLNMFIFILSFRMLYYSLKPVIIVKQTELPEKAI